MNRRSYTVRTVRKVPNRPAGLIAIVVYKAFNALFLAGASLALFLTVKNYQYLLTLSEDSTLEGKLEIIKWFLDKILKVNPRTLQFSSIAVALYSAVTAVEAIGLWYQKAWARILVLLLVGISIPPEIFELFQGVSLLKLAAFIVNTIVFWYLLRHSLSVKNDSQIPEITEN